LLNSDSDSDSLSERFLFIDNMFLDNYKTFQLDRAMVRWICCSKLVEHTPISSFLHKPGILEITEVLRSCCLRWYGHVQCATTQINFVTHSAMPGSRGQGRPRKTWSESIKKDIVTWPG